MQTPKATTYKTAVRGAVRETLLLGLVFLIALALFFTTVHFIAGKEAAHELQNRPRGLLIGWLATITLGLLLGRTRREEGAVALPKSLVVVRESLQAAMLLLFFSVLAYTSYFLHTSRKLVVQRPWALLIGWFALLVFIAFFAKTSAVIRSVRRK